MDALQLVESRPTTLAEENPQFAELLAETVFETELNNAMMETRSAETVAKAIVTLLPDGFAPTTPQSVTKFAETTSLPRDLPAKSATMEILTTTTVATIARSPPDTLALETPQFASLIAVMESRPDQNNATTETELPKTDVAILALLKLDTLAEPPDKPAHPFAVTVTSTDPKLAMMETPTPVTVALLLAKSKTDFLALELLASARSLTSKLPEDKSLTRRARHPSSLDSLLVLEVL